MLKNRLKIIHVITGLNSGGAEHNLFKLCTSDKNNIHIVVSMMGLGDYGKALEDNGITVFCLNMSRKNLDISKAKVLYQIIKSANPDIVQTWMYHADLLGGVVARVAGVKKVFWGVRHATLISGVSKKRTIIISKICALLSFFIPYKIISCSNKAIDNHMLIGYSKKKFIYIANGCDTKKFSYRDPRFLNSIVDLPSDVPLLGMVARYDPLKDHDNLFGALSLLKKRKVSFHCLLVGHGMTEDNKIIADKLCSLGLIDSITLLGPVTNVPDIMSALDIHVLSSKGEAFPNVLLECMACGVPCISTDVGDAREIIADLGWIVPVGQSNSLSIAIEESLMLIKDVDCFEKLKFMSRERVINNYSMNNMCLNFNIAWNS